MATASRDSTILIWQLDSTGVSFKRLRHLRPSYGVIWSVDFAKNSKWILFTSTDLTKEFGYTCHVVNFNGDWTHYGWADYDTTSIREGLRTYVDLITGHVVSARFTRNDAAIIISSLNEGRLLLADQDSSLGNHEYISYRIRTADESNWRLMTINKIFKNYKWTEDQIYQYGGIDMSVNDYIASNISGSNYTNLFHWDRIPIRKFRGINPNFSSDGKYLLCINGDSLLLYPADEKEIIRLVNEEAIFGELNVSLNNWFNFFELYY